MSGRRTAVFICVLLTLAVVGVYWQTLGHSFTNYDDDAYVTENPHVRTGLTLPNVVWALGAMYESNWHPLTWMSHMLDCTLFGLNPKGHHATNLLIHLASTLLLFGLFRRMTGSNWWSAFVAALFAVHPLHVESVAWIAERKDLLSTLFWIAAMWAYFRYTERPSAARYLGVALLFLLGLMSKPMVVTLPITLLLLDYWPLRRSDQSGDSGYQAPSTKHLILEKVPLYLMSVASCAVTFVAQRGGLAVSSLNQFPIGERLANAAVSYVQYIGKMVCPIGFAVFYPHPKDTLPVLHVVGSVVLLVGITALVLRFRQRRYLLFGWLWYVITLLPVIGIVQVGWQAMADRYTYVPLIGMFVMVVWGMPEIIRKGEREKGGEAERPTSNVQRATPNRQTTDTPHPTPGTSNLVLMAVALVAIAALGVSAHRQAGYWRDSVTLFTHAILVTQDNPVAENNLAMALSERGMLGEAMVHHRNAIRLEPGWADAHYNFGRTLLAGGRSDEAVEEFRRALDIYPRHAPALNNLGVALMNEGDARGAVDAFMKSLEVRPDNPRTYLNLGAVLADQGKTQQAMVAYRMAVQLDPSMPDAHHNLAILFSQTGDIEGAIAECREALRLKPDWPDAQNNLAYLLATKPGASDDELEEAVVLAESAYRSTRGADLNYLDTLTTAYARAGRYRDAASTARKAAQLAASTGHPDAAKRFAALARLYESK